MAKRHAKNCKDCKTSYSDPNCPHCPDCGERLYIGSYPYCPHGDNHIQAGNEIPVTFYGRGPNGEFFAMGHEHDKLPPGFVKCEMRNRTEYNALMKELDAKDRAKAERLLEAEDRFFSEHESRNRSDLRQQMQHMPVFWRDFAQAAIDYNNSRPARTAENPNNLLIPMEYDRTGDILRER